MCKQDGLEKEEFNFFSDFDQHKKAPYMIEICFLLLKVMMKTKLFCISLIYNGRTNIVSYV